MVPTTRRRLLHAVGGSLCALAGCTELTDGTDPGDDGRRDPDGGTGSPTAGNRTPTDGTYSRDPETHVLRTAGESAVAWFVPEDAATTPDGGVPPPEGTTTPPRGVQTRGLIASEAAVERLRFADVEGAEAARQFAADTDFETETLYLEPNRVRECHGIELCYVDWTSSEVETQYGGSLRDADVACSPDVRETSTWLIRIPDVIDPVAVHGYGSGWSSSGCRPPGGYREDHGEGGEERTPVPAAPLTNASDGGDR